MRNKLQISSKQITRQFGREYIFFSRLIYLRETAWVGGQRARERESQADSPLSAEPHVGLDAMTPRSPPKPKPRVGHRTICATQAPGRDCISVHLESKGNFSSSVFDIYCSVKQGWKTSIGFSDIDASGGLVNAISRKWYQGRFGVG